MRPFTVCAMIDEAKIEGVVGVLIIVYTTRKRGKADQILRICMTPQTKIKG